MNVYKRISTGILICFLFFTIAACTGANTATKESTCTPPTATASSRPQITIPAPDTSAEKIYYVEDYGAKGDGVNNDGPSISKTIAAALTDDSDSNIIVQFQSDKIYRVTSVPESNRDNHLFDLKKAKNIHIQGNNTTILLKAPVRIGNISLSENCSISGFIFDYSPKPFVIGTVVDKGVDYIDFTTTEDMIIPERWAAPSVFFAFKNKENERQHFFSTGYTQLGEKKYRLHITSDSTGKASQTVYGEEFILPVPGMSHSDCGGSAFSVGQSAYINLNDIQIYSLPNFGFYIYCNDGAISFRNISFRPEPNSNIYLVSWRDGFHVKDNSGQLLWDGCDIGPLGDDAFNLSSVGMKVTAYTDSKDRFELMPMEGYAGRPALQIGDAFIAYNNFTGELIGEGHILKIINTRPVRFVSDIPLPNVDDDTYFYFYSYANPNYIIRNSTIEGTVRVRCPGTFENCKFNIYWLKVENERFFEGPIPKDITFKNCTFQSLSDRNKNIVQIGTRFQNDVTAPASYKCKNILFDHCVWGDGCVYTVEPGNEVFVR